MTKRKFDDQPFGSGAGPRQGGPIGGGARIAQHDPHEHQRNVAGPRTPARTVLVYGPPKAGVTSLCSVLAHKDVLPNVAFVDAILGEPPEALAARVEDNRTPGITTVLVGGRPLTVDDLQALHDMRVIDPIDGIVVRVGRSRMAAHGEWSRQALFTEQRLGVLSIPHYMINVDQLDHAAASLALRARLA